MPYFALLSALLIVASPFGGSQAFDLPTTAPDDLTLAFEDEFGGDGYNDDGGSADLDDPDGDGDDEDARGPEEDDDDWDSDDTDRDVRA
jgi:hypothetical protein